MLKDNLKNNLKLQKVFIYNAIEDEQEVFDNQLWILLNEPRFDGQVEIVKDIEWLFFTNNNYYNMVGLRSEELWYMDDEGDLCKAEFKLQDLPFRLRPNLLNKEHWKWSTRSEVAKAFLYYFDYCEKNSIPLSPENLAWKEPLLKFIKDNEQ